MDFLAPLGLQGFAVGDGQVPGALNTGVITNPPGRTNTLAQNAEILGQYINGVKRKTGAEMVDLVVHSMGGMISRYYIDRVMQDRDVAQLVMLGSPMGGSDCSVLPAALGFYLPASIEIRESYMKGVFNQQITHRKGIEFYDLGGTAINEAFKSPCTEVPNDTVVSFESINAIPLQSSREDVIHSDLTLSQTAFEQYVNRFCKDPAGTFPIPAGSGSRRTGRVAPGLYARLHRPRRPGRLHRADHQHRAGRERCLVRTVRCLPLGGYHRTRRERQHHRAHAGEEWVHPGRGSRHHAVSRLWI